MRRFEQNDIRRALVAFAAIALAAGPAACSLMTSLDGLVDGSDAGGGETDGSLGSHPDVGAGGHDGASGGEAGDDTGGGDDGNGDDANGDDTNAPPTDAGDGGLLGSDASDAGDAADARDAADGGWCATQSSSLLFCDDFDETALKTPWDMVSSMNGSATLATGLFTSSPNAMLLTTVGGSQQVDCAGYRSFAKLTSGQKVLTLSFDLRVIQVDTSNKSDAVLAAIQLYDSFNDTWDLQLEAYYDSGNGMLTIDFSEDGQPGDGGANQYKSHLASQELALGVWTRITMELTLPTPLVPSINASARLLFGSTVVASPTQLHIETIAPTPEILVGTTYVGPGNGGWTVRYDDVTFSQQ